jgi:DNA-binding Lrp family transcriptional regulator
MNQTPTTLDALDKKIIQILQDQFPLVERPYKHIGDQLNLPEDHILSRLKQLQAAGVTQKIGAVLDTSKIGQTAATLVAFKVPQHRIDEVSEVINQYEGVSHNYEREHEYNVWFTLKAPNDTKLDETLTEITQQTNTAPTDILNLPTKQCFKIRVRFQLT